MNKNCIECGTEFTLPRGTSKQRFCSVKCYRASPAFNTAKRLFNPSSGSNLYETNKNPKKKD